MMFFEHLLKHKKIKEIKLAHRELPKKWNAIIHKKINSIKKDFPEISGQVLALWGAPHRGAGPAGGLPLRKA